jgi:hypothetical protein
VVVARCNVFDGGRLGLATKARTPKIVARAWEGGGSCGAEGVYDCGGWNACAGAEGWKDW